MELQTKELERIEQSKAEQIKNTFEPMVERLEEFEISFNDIIKEAKNGITEMVILKAKDLRERIAKVRTASENIRKEQKAEHLLAGRAIDGVANIIKWAIQDKEKNLKNIEQHYELQEKARKEVLQAERVALLKEYVDNAQDINLADMDDEIWQIYYAQKKSQYEERCKEEQAVKERQEQERLERVALEEENHRLREQINKEEQAKKRADEAQRKKRDATKMKDLVSELTAIKTKYAFKSARNKARFAKVKQAIEEIITTLEK
jgi:hypothetical protein